MSSGLGFNTINVLARMSEGGWTRTTVGGAYIPHLELDAQETDQAIEAMRLSHAHLHVTLDAVYLKDWGVTGTARRLGKGPSTIHAHLDQVDRFIDAWLHEQRRLKEEKEALARGRAYMERGSFTP